MDGKDAMPPPAETANRWTYDDFQRLPEENRIREIIGGEYFVTPSPSIRHQEVALRLLISLGSFLEEHPGRGRMFHAPLDCVLSFHDVVEPDLVFIAADQLQIMTEKNIQGAPALLIEVLSPSTRKRDEKIKRDLYARNGVREYWVVDPKLGLIRVYRRTEDGRFLRLADLAANDHSVLTTPLLPNWSLALDRLFR